MLDHTDGVFSGGVSVFGLRIVNQWGEVSEGGGFEIEGGEGGGGGLVDDSEEAAVAAIDGEAEDEGVGGERSVGEKSVDNSGVGNGLNYGTAERADEEVLVTWVPRKRFREEVS